MKKVFSETDQLFMRAAIKMAESAKGSTFPNPAVGALVIKNGTILGLGKTNPCGGAHAEVIALQEAGARAKDATLYVTLEPCCHHGRTPPCTRSIIESGISRVVVAVRDPNPLVAGKGIRDLRAHGINVEFGLLSAEAYLLNEDFFWMITQKRPWVSLKLALTLDGKIADVKKNSQWITSPAARTRVHELRRRHAAIIVGRGTLLLDDPQLNVRLVREEQPARIVFSSTDQLPGTLNFITGATLIRSIIVCPGGRYQEKYVRKDAVEVWHTGKINRRQSMQSFLSMAMEEGLTSLLVEGGSALGSSFLEERLVNRLYLFFGNSILGDGLNGIAFKKGLSLKAPLRLVSPTIETIGSDNIMVTGLPQWSS